MGVALPEPVAAALATRADDQLVQLLTPSGELVADEHFHYSGTDQDLVEDLRAMLLTRAIDAEGTALQRKGELGLWVQSLGQEAAQIGSARAFTGNDLIVPSYRELGVYLALGLDPVEFLGTFRGTAMVDWPTGPANLHLPSFVIGTQTLHAVGMAMALQRDGRVGNPNPDDNGAVVVYFGDGATSQGDVNESFVFAAAAHAPLVFFCQNNQWAISEPTTVQTPIPLYRRAAGFGFPGVRVDGNDVLAVRAVTEWALERARSGGGPVLIEAFTYRMGAHTTSDDPTKYRSAEEEAEWKAKDPVDRLRTYLLAKGLIDDAWLGQVAAEGAAQAERLRTGCVQLTEPQLADSFELVYTDTPAHLLRQRDEFQAYEASFEVNA